MRTENRIELTDRWLRNVEPAAPGKRDTRWDVAVPGLGVRITDKRAVSFFIMKRIAGRPAPERITLGRYPVLALAEARREAKGRLGIIEQGKTRARSRPLSGPRKRQRMPRSRFRRSGPGPIASRPGILKRTGPRAGCGPGRSNGETSRRTFCLTGATGPSATSPAKT